MSIMVSTGQITIVDNNDAKPLTAYITASPGFNQIFSKDESTTSYNPSWFTANSSNGLILSAYVYVGGTATPVTAQLTSRKFTYSPGGAAITTATTDTNFCNDSLVDVTTPFTVAHDGTGSTMKIKGNLKDSIGTLTVYFEGDYSDPVTGLTTHVIATATLSELKTGTNSVFVLNRGVNSIEGSTTATKNVAYMSATLMRAGGPDETGITYQFFMESGGVSTQVSTSVSGYATKFGLKSVAYAASPSGASADLGVNVPVVTAWSTNNTLVIGESAVQGMQVFKVIAKDADGNTYQSFFTIYDVSDAYRATIVSSAGDKLQNGVGSTNLTPIVYYGSTPLADYSAWQFQWSIYDRNGYKCAFVDTAKISTSGGRGITANTTGSSATFTYDSTGGTYAFAAGDIIKCVKPNGLAFFYEVASSAANVVTIRTPSTNTFLSFSNYPAPSATTDFVGGKLFGCTTNGSRTTNAQASITLTGDDVDAKCNVMVDAYKP